MCGTPCAVTHVPLYKVFGFAALLLGVAALFFVRLHMVLVAEDAGRLVQFAGETADVVGVVTNDPERRETSLHVYVSVAEVNGEWVEGTMLAILPRDAAIAYGDTISIRGKISLPEVFETNTGRLFDYPNYLRVRGVSVLMRYSIVEDTQTGKMSTRKILYAAKHTFESSLEKILPEPNVSLMEGILLGARRGIPDDLTNAFVVSGLIHVVVLSGYNISIVAEAMLRALSFLPRTISFITGGTMIILFVLMTGAGATAVRACIMGLIAIVARYMNRPAAALRALFVAGVLMVLWNPLSLLYDPSFILSMLATFGLITLSPWVETFLPKFFNRMPSIKSIAASTIAVQIYILPALLYLTGVLSFVSLPANILALPVVPLVMLLGFVSGMLATLHPLLALPTAFLAQLLLGWMSAVATTAASLPFAATIVTAFPVWVAIAAYVPLTVFAIFVYRQNAAR